MQCRAYSFLQQLTIQKIFMKEDKKNDRFESYPRPAESDKQLQNQPEYIDQQPNDFEDKSISDLPIKNAERISDDPESDMEK